MREELKERVKLALERQDEMILHEIHGARPRPRVLTGFDQLQREVVDKLNSVTKDLGLPDYFSHNGFDKQTSDRISVLCTGCKPHEYITFTKSLSQNGTILLTYQGPAHGLARHSLKNLKAHITINPEAEALKGRKQKEETKPN